MNRAQITNHLHIALSTVLNQDLPELTEETRLFDDLGLDSTSVIELLMALEDTLSLEIDADALEPEIFHTVGSLTDYLMTSAIPDLARS